MHNYESTYGRFPPPARRNPAGTANVFLDPRRGRGAPEPGPGHRRLTFAADLDPRPTSSSSTSSTCSTSAAPTTTRQAPNNLTAGKTVIRTFLCPSTTGRDGDRDAAGFAYTDYSPPVTVVVNASTPADAVADPTTLPSRGGPRLPCA